LTRGDPLTAISNEWAPQPPPRTAPPCSAWCCGSVAAVWPLPLCTLGTRPWLQTSFTFPCASRLRPTFRLVVVCCSEVTSPVPLPPIACPPPTPPHPRQPDPILAPAHHPSLPRRAHYFMLQASLRHTLSASFLPRPGRHRCGHSSRRQQPLARPALSMAMPDWIYPRHHGPFRLTQCASPHRPLLLLLAVGMVHRPGVCLAIFLPSFPPGPSPMHVRDRSHCALRCSPTPSSTATGSYDW
jgi:hypothetical protein